MNQSYRVVLECNRSGNTLTLDIEEADAFSAQKVAEEMFDKFHVISIASNLK